MPRKLVPCGTPSAYRRHKYNGEMPCDVCREAYRRRSREEYHSRSREKHEWYMRNMREMRRKSHLLRTYGITVEQFDRLFDSQNRSCACCKSEDPKSEQGWCLDHDHDTKIVRGILCSSCNRGIGFLGDTLEGVQRAVAYLKSRKNACVPPSRRRIPATKKRRR